MSFKYEVSFVTALSFTQIIENTLLRHRYKRLLTPYIYAIYLRPRVLANVIPFSILQHFYDIMLSQIEVTVPKGVRLNQANNDAQRLTQL